MMERKFGQATGCIEVHAYARNALHVKTLVNNEWRMMTIRSGVRIHTINDDRKGKSCNTNVCINPKILAWHKPVLRYLHPDP